MSTTPSVLEDKEPKVKKPVTRKQGKEEERTKQKPCARPNARRGR